MIPQIKYIAMYKTRPFSGIRWIGYVQNIKPFRDSDKFEISARVAPMGPRYTKMELIKNAKKLSDIF